MRYAVLGPLTVSAGGKPVNVGGPKQRLVLALLLTDAGRALTPDRLIDGVRGDDPPDRARHTLQAYVSELRSLLDNAIEWTGHGYRLAVDKDQVDSIEFERLLDRGRQALPDDPDQAATMLADGLGRWRGEPFADLGDAPGLQSEVRRLQQLRLAALEARIDADLKLGRHQHLAEELETLTREFPFREKFRAQQMVAVYRCGRQAEALRAYDKTRTSLSEELGVDPSPELQRLQEKILRQDPGLDPPTYRPVKARTVGKWADVDGSRTFGRTIRGLELRGVIGTGASTVVHRAYQSSVGREVAIKVIGPEIAGQPDFISRFEAEAQVVASLEHPHVIGLYDFWRDSDGAYLVMPWLTGGSVAQAFDRGPWSLATTLRAIEQVGAALSYAHRRRVTHGAVTPSNVLLDQDDNAYLADFGIASAHSRSALSSPSVAPERRHSEPATVAGDVYAFGVLIRQLLGGPAPGDSAFPPITGIRDDVPDDLDRVLQCATAPRPADRHPRIDDLLRDVRRVLGADVVGAAAQPWPEPVIIRNPYKGLRAFQETDAGDFFGRDDLTGRLLETLHQHRLVAVVGPSGSGKSSLVRAGMLPAVRSGALPGSEAWLITDMFPGAYPFEELAAALSRVAVERTDVWDVTSSELIAELPAGGPAGNALDVEWSPNGALLATTGTDAVRIFDIETQAEVRSLGGVGGRVEDVEFGPHGQQVAVLRDEIRIEDLQSTGGMEVAEYSTGRPMSHAAWTPDRSKVVTVGTDGQAEMVDVLDTDTGELLASISHPIREAPPPGPAPPPAKVEESPDGRFIAATLHGTTTLVIDALTFEPVTVLDPGGTPGSFSPDSRRLIVGDFEAAYVYDTRTWSTRRPSGTETRAPSSPGITTPRSIPTATSCSWPTRMPMTRA